MLSMLLAVVNLITCDLASTISGTGKRDLLLLRITPKEIKMLRPILEVSFEEEVLHLKESFHNSIHQVSSELTWCLTLNKSSSTSGSLYDQFDLSINS